MAEVETIPARVIKITQAHFIGPNDPENNPTIDTRISEYGPDDMDWLEFTLAIEDEFDVEVSDEDLQDMKTNDFSLQDIANYLEIKTVV